jgi:hypothetical protein
VEVTHTALTCTVFLLSFLFSLPFLGRIEQLAIHRIKSHSPQKKKKKKKKKIKEKKKKKKKKK